LAAASRVLASRKKAVLVLSIQKVTCTKRFALSGQSVQYDQQKTTREKQKRESRGRPALMKLTAQKYISPLDKTSAAAYSYFVIQSSLY
jgi:hypothetical protein